MALYKEIRQPDGVTTAYHRVLYVRITTNSHNSIAVASYVDAPARAAEKEGEFAQPYRQAVTYETAYTPAMTVSGAYDFLKTLPAFADAVDA